VIVSEYDAVAAAFFPDTAACEAVTVAVPALTGAITPELSLTVAIAVLLMLYVMEPPEGIDEAAVLEQAAVLPI
jgi:hypothetical protein